MLDDLEPLLKWCADNGVTFAINVADGRFVVSAKCDNITSEYDLPAPYSPVTLGIAVWSAIFSVRHGSEFHQQLGYFPTAEETKGTKE